MSRLSVGRSNTRIIGTRRGAASSGGASSVTSVNRNGLSAAGGATVVITGTGFSGAPSVLIGGNAASSVVVDSSTQITCVAPAYGGATPATVNVQVANQVGSNLVEYLPAPSTTYVTHGFEDGTDGGFSAEVESGSDSITFPSDGGFAGTRYARCSAVAGEYARLNYGFTSPTNPGLNATGVYQRYYLRCSQATIDNTAAGQIKLTLSRYSGGPNYSWLMCGYGNEFGPHPQFIALKDFLAERLDPGGTSDSRTGVNITADTWMEVQMWYRRTAGAGTGSIKLWLNGLKEMDISHAEMGSETAAHALLCQFGIVVSQNVTGSVVVDLDNIAIADGFIDP